MSTFQTNASRLLACAGLALTVTCISVCGPARADDQIATATFSGIDNSYIAIESRTSDFLAIPQVCQTRGTGGGCTATLKNSSIPKNIGNMLCVPIALGTLHTDASCQQLLNEVKGCQKNSAEAACDLQLSNDPDYNYRVYAPYCNHETSKNASTSATWAWSIRYDATGKLTLYCSQSGFQGVSD
jgi:hypothetical protein